MNIGGSQVSSGHTHGSTVSGVSGKATIATVPKPKSLIEAMVETNDKIERIDHMTAVLEVRLFGSETSDGASPPKGEPNVAYLAAEAERYSDVIIDRLERILRQLSG